MAREAREVVKGDQWVMETGDRMIKVNRVTSAKAEETHMPKPTNHSPFPAIPTSTTTLPFNSPNQSYNRTNLPTTSNSPTTFSKVARLTHSEVTGTEVTTTLT